MGHLLYAYQLSIGKEGTRATRGLFEAAESVLW